MHHTAAAQKMNPQPGAVSDEAFHSSFYTPYKAAVCSLLPVLCAARSALCRQTGEDGVHAITFRLKSPGSIRDKLAKKGLPVSATAASAALCDIAGMRVVFADAASVYRYAELIKNSPGLSCFAEHDYIANPKASGYQSLHLLLRVPVSPEENPLTVPVELQLRTTAMDAWASAEHALCYKPIK